MNPRRRIAMALALLAASEAISNARGAQTTLYARLYRRMNRARVLLGATNAEISAELAALGPLWWSSSLRTLRAAWWFAVRALHTTCVHMRRIERAISSITQASRSLVDALGKPADDVVLLPRSDPSTLGLRGYAVVRAAAVARARAMVGQGTQLELGGVMGAAPCST